MTDDGKLILEELGFCNCTHPHAVLRYLRRNLLRSHGVKDDPELSMPTIFFRQWAHSRRLIEHRGDLSHTWLTDDGLELVSRIGRALAT